MYKQNLTIAFQSLPSYWFLGDQRALQSKKQQCLSVMRRYNFDVTVEKGGDEKVLVLFGDITVSDCTFLVEILIEGNFPMIAPIVTVTPKPPDVIVLGHPVVDVNGVVTLASLTHWHAEESTISKIVQDLYEAFEERPFITAQQGSTSHLDNSGTGASSPIVEVPRKTHITVFYNGETEKICWYNPCQDLTVLRSIQQRFQLDPNIPLKLRDEEDDDVEVTASLPNGAVFKLVLYNSPRERHRPRSIITSASASSSSSMGVKEQQAFWPEFKQLSINGSNSSNIAHQTSDHDKQKNDPTSSTVSPPNLPVENTHASELQNQQQPPMKSSLIFFF